MDNIDIAYSLLQAESIRRAAEKVVKEWEAGIYTVNEYGCGGLAMACLRDALDGYISLDVQNYIPRTPRTGHPELRDKANKGDCCPICGYVE